MDDSNNNGTLNTQTTPNDTTTPMPDYNTMQPQSNPLGVLPVDNTSGSVPVDAPTTQENSLVDSLAGIPVADTNAPQVTQEEVSTSMVSDPVLEAPQASPTVNIQETQVLPDSTLTPMPGVASVVDTPQAIPQDSQVVDSNMQPELNTSQTLADSFTPAPIAQPEVLPVEETTAPVMPEVPVAQPEVLPTQDQFATTMPETPVDVPAQDSFAPVMPETPVVQEPVLDSQPAFPQATPAMDMSASLSQPQESVQASVDTQVVPQPEQEVVNTLDEGQKEEGKDSSVVIIVLIVIIVLLLVGIGYFGYKIFLG